MEVVSKYHVSDEAMRAELVIIDASKENPAAFAPLYDKYHEPIFRYIHQRIDDKDTAFDLVQQVFLKALENIRRFEFRGLPFASWLYRIAKSEVYQALRNNQKLRAVNIDTVQVGELFEEIKEDLSEEKAKKATETIAALEEDDLQLIEMRFFERRPFKEIGQILGITEVHAKVKTYRLLDRIRKEIAFKTDK